MAKRPRLPVGHNTLDQILFDQGFGERRVCEGLILNGLVQVNGEVVDDLDWPVTGRGRAQRYLV